MSDQRKIQKKRSELKRRALVLMRERFHWTDEQINEAYEAGREAGLWE